MEQRIKQLESDVVLLKKRYAELLDLTIGGHDRVINHLKSANERVDDLKFVLEEYFKTLMEIYELVKEPENQLHSKENVKALQKNGNVKE